MIKAALLHFEEYERRIFWGFAVLLLISLAFYVYFLSMSIIAVIARKGAESETHKINSHMSVLESQYVVLDKKIDLAMAHERGFEDISVPTYISAVPHVNTLTLRTER